MANQAVVRCRDSCRACVDILDRWVTQAVVRCHESFRACVNIQYVVHCHATKYILGTSVCSSLCCLLTADVHSLSTNIAFCQSLMCESATHRFKHQPAHHRCDLSMSTAGRPLKRPRAVPLQIDRDECVRRLSGDRCTAVHLRATYHVHESMLVQRLSATRAAYPLP
jgi:hypothetical protein